MFTFRSFIALDIAFGSLYSDEVDVNVLRGHVIPTLAAARLLDLTGLLAVCQDVMMETLSAITVCKYHQAACTYALMEVERKLVCLTSYFSFTRNMFYYLNEAIQNCATPSG